MRLSGPMGIALFVVILGITSVFYNQGWQRGYKDGNKDGFIAGSMDVYTTVNKQLKVVLQWYKDDMVRAKCPPLLNCQSCTGCVVDLGHK